VTTPFIPAASGTPERRQQDLDMLKNPSRWPHRRVIPVKRWDGHELFTAVVVLDLDGLKLVEGANLWMPDSWTTPPGERLTPEQIVARGYTVD
jgi:hypothetical protein